MDKTIFPSRTVCFTGHRDIPPQKTDEVRRYTMLAVEEAYEAGYRTFICGGARGYDTIAARTVLFFRESHPEIQLVIAVPCAGQADRWPVQEKKEYNGILKLADLVIVLSEAYYTGCMQNRNRYMVDHSALCICYMTRFNGGTWSTVRYALHRGIGLKNIAVQGPAGIILKENTWNYISIYRFAFENVSIVHLFHFPKRQYRKKNILALFCVNAKKGAKNSANQ